MLRSPQLSVNIHQEMLKELGSSQEQSEQLIQLLKSLPASPVLFCCYFLYPLLLPWREHLKRAKILRVPPPCQV